MVRTTKFVHFTLSSPLSVFLTVPLPPTMSPKSRSFFISAKVREPKQSSLPTSTPPASCLLGRSPLESWS